MFKASICSKLMITNQEEHTLKKKLIFIFLFTAVLFTPVFLSAQAADDLESLQDKRIDLIKTNLDYVWVILSAMLVFFMQAGFMALESGMARSKNSINVAIKNLTDFVLGVVGFWILGFGLMFGKSWHGLIGTTDFLISIENPWTAAFFLFQAVFVGTAATIDSGAVCERAKLKPYILLSLLVSVVIYPIFGHWAWGSFLHGTDPLTGGAGWLEARGFKDFAGSSVVHSVGGWMALAGVIVVGSRLGKFQRDPKTGKKTIANKIAPGDMRFVFIGTFILFFGWFGFNCGSTLSATSDIAQIGLNTTLAACFGCIASSILSWIFHPEKKIEGEMIANGVLAGLVGITAGCAFVGTVEAAIIGTVAGIIVFAGSHFLEKVLKLDDVVGAIPVHGFCGAWGTIAVGLFIRPEMLGDMTRAGQIQIQLVGVGVCFLWSFGLGFLLYFLVDRFLGGTRVTEEEEIMGLNIAEHGATSSILELANTMNDLTQSGNFTEDTMVNVEHGTEIGDLANIFNEMIGRVREALNESNKQKALAEQRLQEAKIQTEKTESARREIEQTRIEANKKRESYIGQVNDKISDVTGGIDNVRLSMEKTSEATRTMQGSFTNMDDMLNRMLVSLNEVYEHLDQINTINSTTTETVSDSQLSIEDLGNITREIETMVKHIDDIANQTHILSINSGIEAARAGKAGTGFVVIANEVRTLSSETSKVASSINQKLVDVEEKVDNVTVSMEKILKIIAEVGRLNETIVGIISNNRELSAAVSEESASTKSIVKDVSIDISETVKETEKLSDLGATVQKELDAISSDENL